MKLVVIESPFAGEVQSHIAYAKACMNDALRRGEAPYASHLLFTRGGILDDTIPAERERGMRAGFAWGAHADLVAVYIDRGISSGMRRGAREAFERGSPIEIRSLTREIPPAESDEILKNLIG